MFTNPYSDIVLSSLLIYLIVLFIADRTTPVAIKLVIYHIPNWSWIMTVVIPGNWSSICIFIYKHTWGRIPWSWTPLSFRVSFIITTTEIVIPIPRFFIHTILFRWIHCVCFGTVIKVIHIVTFIRFGFVIISYIIIIFNTVWAVIPYVIFSIIFILI